MRKIIFGLVAAAGLLSPCAAGAADAIYGVWGRDGHANDKMEFYDCAGKLCAKGAPAPADGSPPPQILRNAAKTGENIWAGDLFNPENGKMYKGTITLESPTKMTLKGCLVAFLCQSEGWTRLSGPAKALAPAAGKPAAAKPAGHDPKAPAKAPKAKPHATEPEPAAEGGNAGE